MKKIEKVSIADISFALDSDAYVSLKRYLDSLHAYYDKDPDGNEIIADIEARIAELILNEQVYTKIVAKQLIDSIIAQLGTPEEIEERDEQPSGSTSAAEPSIPKRLYRIREGRSLGGVCTGMARFWDVSVARVRLVFLLPMIFFIITVPFDRVNITGFIVGWSWVFIVIYIVLWFAIPMAKTPRQKLEARGEKITPSSIRQNLQEGATTPATKKAASVFAEILAVAGRVLLFIIKFVLVVIGILLLISALGMLIGMFVAIFNPASIGIVAAGSLMGLSIVSPMVFVLLILFCVMVPLLVLGVALLNLVFGRKGGRVFYVITIGLWVLAMIFCSIVVATNARYLRNEFRDGNVTIGWFSETDDNFNRKHIIRYRHDDGHKEIREIQGDVEDVEVAIIEDSLVIIMKTQKDGIMESDTLTIGKAWNGDRERRVIIRNTKD